jgi:hypothetical protein
VLRKMRHTLPGKTHFSYHCGVTVYEIRLANLQILVNAFGSARELADHTGTDEAHLRQILRGGQLPSGRRKNVGNDLARKIEKGCCLESGAMDKPMNPTPPAPDEVRLAADEQMILALYRRASTKLRRLVRLMLELERDDQP